MNLPALKTPIIRESKESDETKARGEAERKGAGQVKDATKHQALAVRANCVAIGLRRGHVSGT